MTGSLEFSALSFQQFINYSAGFPTLVLVPVVVSMSMPLLCDSLYLLVCLFNLGESGLPCVISSLTNPRGVVDFPVCSVFFVIVRVK